MSASVPWFQREFRQLSVLWCVICGMFGSVVASIFGQAVLLAFEIPLDNSRTISVHTLSFPKSVPFLAFAAMREEILYRFPLFFVSSISPRLVIPAAIASSILFGYHHGDLSNIAVQGVIGLILCIVFLKSGGARRDPFKGIAVSGLTHFLYNSLVWALVSP